MENQYSRTEIILGKDVLEKLSHKRVAVFGIGGVGCSVVEALARSGIGSLDLIDNDNFCLSNLNRQLFATHKTIGKAKVEVAAERVAEINPLCKVKTHKLFYLPETKSQFNFADYDYIVDAIDTVTAKISLILAAKEADVPIISAMGAGNKIHPEAFEISDIYKTSACPLAHIMRKELKKRGVEKLKVVFSKEKPLNPLVDINSDGTPPRRSTPGSVSFVPPVAGFIIAGEVIKDLAGIKD